MGAHARPRVLSTLLVDAAWSTFPCRISPFFEAAHDVRLRFSLFLALDDCDLRGRTVWWETDVFWPSFRSPVRNATKERAPICRARRVGFDSHDGDLNEARGDAGWFLPHARRATSLGSRQQRLKSSGRAHRPNANACQKPDQYSPNIFEICCAGVGT